MRVTVTSQQRYWRTPDGDVWTDAKYAYHFWTRYLAVFDRVRVIGRCGRIRRPPSDWLHVAGPNVEFAPVPLVRGAWGYLVSYGWFASKVRNATPDDGAIILRVPGELATCLDTALWHAHRPYGVECVGDPHDLYAPGAVRSEFRPYLRWWYPRRMRRQCFEAVSAAYVTERTLQQRYPANPNAFQTYYSSIELGNEAFIDAPREDVAVKPPYRLVTVGTLAQLYKAPDVLIDAVAQCIKRGVDLRLRIVGDGKHRRELENRCRTRGIAEQVTFVGHLATPDAVRAELDAADLFVLPSRQEGLPRAVIEAMARGLPCIGTRIGGTPELLTDDALVPPGDVKSLSERIESLLADRPRMLALAAENLKRSHAYHHDRLAERRKAMYQALKERTEAWQKRQNR